MNNFPLLTVGTLSYNTGKYVVEALNCVKDQKYPNIQHIIVDDCSTDNSVELIDQWIKSNVYSCTFIKHESNRGTQFGLKEIFGLATGKYIVFISDDLWVQNAFIDLITYFEQLDSSYAMIYGDTQMIDNDGKIVIPSMYENYRGKNFEPPSGAMFKEVVKDFYFFIQSAVISLDHFRRLNYSFSPDVISEDWDWQLGLSRNFNILGLKSVYGKYRYHEASVGRTTWTDKKIHKVYLSHINMLLNYYHHPKNDEMDRKLIFGRVWKFYRLLSINPNFERQSNLILLDRLFTVTRKKRVLLVIACVAMCLSEKIVSNLLRVLSRTSSFRVLNSVIC